MASIRPRKNSRGNTPCDQCARAHQEHTAPVLKSSNAKPTPTRWAQSTEAALRERRDFPKVPKSAAARSADAIDRYLKSSRSADCATSVTVAHSCLVAHELGHLPAR